MVEGNSWLVKLRTASFVPTGLHMNAQMHAWTHTYTHKINSKIKYFSIEYKNFKLKVWNISFLIYSGSCYVAQVGHKPAIFLSASGS